jgi:type I restriction enzyme M protein
MAVAMLDPREDQLILDPACGTGGFLIAAMSHVIEAIHKGEFARWGNNVERAETTIRQRVTRYATKNIVGLDFNPNLVKASKMNMVMNNDGSGGLFQGNSLASPATWDDGLRGRSLMGTVDLLFTNPPFGSKIPVDRDLTATRAFWPSRSAGTGCVPASNSSLTSGARTWPICRTARAGCWCAATSAREPTSR